MPAPEKEIPVIKIQSKDTESGYVEINESDFDPDRDTLYKDKTPTAVPKKLESPPDKP